MHKTASTPLAILYILLVIYASLYPFSDWRDQGIAPWNFLLAPMPRYWTWFDVLLNVAGYVPLGVFLAISTMRTGRSRSAFLLPLALAASLSLCMESIQSYLPARVASKEDWLLNSLGAAVGAATAIFLERMGALDRWSHFRRRWFITEPRGGLVLLASWPFAILFPSAVPFGMGQVFERAEAAFAELLADTPFLELLPVRDIELQPLLPGSAWLCVFLGLLIPTLLVNSLVRVPWRRGLAVLFVTTAGIATSALSSTLSWGPAHAWAWLDVTARWGCGLAVLTGLALTLASWRTHVALLILALGVFLSIINQAPESPYFAQTLQTWEQGRFIRFNGLAQWLGWLWPYAALVYALDLVTRRDPKN